MNGLTGMRRNQDSEKHLRIIRFVISTLVIPLIVAISAYGQSFTVNKVIDGDTLLLTNGEYVRLIGVDTPETKHPEKPIEYFGKEAYLFTKNMAEGKEVRL